MTNADKIRAMSDKELAAFLCNWRSYNLGNCAGCPAEDFCRNGHAGTIDWVQQEAVGNDNG